MSSIIAAEEPKETVLTEDPGATTAPSGTTVEQHEQDGNEAYRKLQGENDKLKSQSDRLQGEFDAYKQVMAPKGELYDEFQKNPTWASVAQKAIEDHQKGKPGAESEQEFNPDDFVPEEAYRPGTPSYKFREEQENTRIKKAVNAAVGGLREERLEDQTLEQLVTSGMSQENARGYMDFLSDPGRFQGGKDLLMGPMAKAFTQFKSGDKEPVVNPPQESYPSAGAYSGGAEAPRSEVDKIMDGIVASGNKRSILKNPI